MLRYTTASDLIADLRRYYHPDEPLLIVSVSGQDIKQRLADEYPDDDCGEPTESSIIAAMRQVESAMQRSDEDARLEERVIDALPTSDCEELDGSGCCCDNCAAPLPNTTDRIIVSELPNDIASANAGESAVICTECNKEITP